MKIIVKRKKKHTGPLVFVLSGESGAGKSTLIKELCRSYGLKKVVPYTTRGRRPGEVNGVDYHFISKEDFISSKEIICKKENGNNYYGLPKGLGGNILDLDPEGIRNLKMEMSDKNVVVISLHQPLLKRIWRMFKRGDKLCSIIDRVRHDKVVFRTLDDMADFICYPKGATVSEVAISIHTLLKLN